MRSQSTALKPEDRGDLLQIGELLLVYHAVGAGDVEQPVEQFLQHRRVVPEHAADLLGVGLEAAGVLARLVEQAADVLELVGRDVEHLLEGGDLVVGDPAVGLGHLGAEHDDGDREGDPLGCVRRLALAPGRAQFVDRMAGGRSDQRAQGAAERKARGAAEYLAPNAHVAGFTKDLWY